MGINLLVTGCTGFLGGRTSKYFAAMNDKYTVTATSRKTIRKEELMLNGCNFIEGDLLDPLYCDRITKNVDVIIHNAALSSPWGSYNDFYLANVVATENLLAAAIKNKVKKFVFISSASIYLNYKNRSLIKESDPLPQKFVNHYATTKLLAEKLVLNKHLKGIQTIALRPRAIIGAEDTVIFPRLIKAYLSGKLKIIGDGNTICDLTCVRNVIGAIECAIEAEEPAMGRAYNISDGMPVVLWQKINEMLIELGFDPVKARIPRPIGFLFASLVENIHRIFTLKGEPKITKFGLGAISTSVTLDITSAQKFLKYTPVQSTDEGIQEFISWYKAQKNVSK